MFSVRSERHIQGLGHDGGNAVLPKSFHEDYPTATLLDDALTFLSNESAIS
jgi:hypothetical protein